MTVEEIRGQNGNYDDFPLGMRVLAVDDDPTCLKLLELLLKKCQYRVTTTSRARIALKMLRENRDRFDLVISDVHMPDMDGFKLLELVGLEMDLPVIMLSANSDPKLVMKGVTHGACDYLVKPIRIEELRNIWQHVIRRKKIDVGHQKMFSDQDKSQHGNIGEDQGLPLTGSDDQSGKLNKKRKDDKDEDEDEEDGSENEDPATQKKPRVVWSIELHRKFVAAVNQLGIEKAVPKRILDMMNVEGLTRENVASHLQKYRLYLRRISSVATQQANRVSALGSNMRMGSLDCLKDFQTLAGPGRLSNTVLSPYAPSAMLGRLNSPGGVNIRNLASSVLIPPAHGQNFSNPINNFGQLPPVLSSSHRETLIQGLPSLELDQFLQNKSTALIGDFNPTYELGIFTTASTFTDTRANCLSSGQNGSELLQGNFSTLNGGGLGNQTSLNFSSYNSRSLNTGVSSSCDYLDPGQCDENWQSVGQLSKFHSSSSPLTETLNNGHLPLSNVRETHSSAVANLPNPLEFSATSTALRFESSRSGLNCQGGFVGDVVSNMNQVQTQRSGTHNQSYSHNSDNVFYNSQLPPNDRSQNMDQNSIIFDGKMDMPLVGRSNGDDSILLQPADTEKSTELRTRPDEAYLLGQMKPLGAFAPQRYQYTDDLMSAVVKQEQDGTRLDGGFAFSPYNFRL